MSLTREVERRLEKCGLVALFDTHRASYRLIAKDSHDYLQNNFGGASLRRDDVAKALKPVMEINETLQNYLGTRKLTQKYWNQYFTDLIIDRVWEDLTQVQP